MSAKPKRFKDGEYHEIRARVHALWPHAFPARGEPCKPLAIGAGMKISADARSDLSHRTARAFLKLWTSRIEYVEAVLAGGPRYDLDGTPQGEVTDSEKAHAQKRFDEIQKRSASPQKAAPEAPQP